MVMFPVEILIQAQPPPTRQNGGLVGTAAQNFGDPSGYGHHCTMGAAHATREFDVTGKLSHYSAILIQQLPTV